MPSGHRDIRYYLLEQNMNYMVKGCYGLVIPSPLDILVTCSNAVFMVPPCTTPSCRYIDVLLIATNYHGNTYLYDRCSISIYGNICLYAEFHLGGGGGGGGVVATPWNPNPLEPLCHPPWKLYH